MKSFLHVAAHHPLRHHVVERARIVKGDDCRWPVPGETGLALALYFGSIYLQAVQNGATCSNSEDAGTNKRSQQCDESILRPLNAA